MFRMLIVRLTGTSGSADLSRSSSVLVVFLKTDVEKVFIDTSLDYELADLNTCNLWKRQRVKIPLLDIPLAIGDNVPFTWPRILQCVRFL
jgi:hypothetical protein